MLFFSWSICATQAWWFMLIFINFVTEILQHRRTNSRNGKPWGTDERSECHHTAGVWVLVIVITPAQLPRTSSPVSCVCHSLGLGWHQQVGLISTLHRLMYFIAFHDYHGQESWWNTGDSNINSRLLTLYSSWNIVLQGREVGKHILSSLHPKQ